jgi:hypothetical protein
MQYACMAVKHVMCNGQENKRKIPHIGGDFSAPGKSSSIFLQGYHVAQRVYNGHREITHVEEKHKIIFKELCKSKTCL